MIKHGSKLMTESDIGYSGGLFTAIAIAIGGVASIGASTLVEEVFLKSELDMSWAAYPELYEPAIRFSALVLMLALLGFGSMLIGISVFLVVCMAISAIQNVRISDND